MQYRRLKISCRCYFFTVVTYKRYPIFQNRQNISLLRAAIKYTRQRHPFRIDAFVLLPNHLHCIWTLPPNDKDFSIRWMLIKAFVKRYTKNNKQPIWQKRFWEHAIRNDKDFLQHLNYVHYNPVKHGLVQSPKDWPYSSFHRYVKAGAYDIDWGTGEKLQTDRGEPA